MVSRLSWYLTKTILTTIGLMMTLLLGLDLVFSLVNEIREVGTGDYTIWRCLLYLLMSVPQKVYQMFPMSALVGTLMGLGVMASNSELIVIQSAGISVKRITKVVVGIALSLGIGLWVVGEFVAPTLDKISNDMKAQALSGGQALKTSNGTWLRDGDDFVHVRNLYVGGHLEGITRYQFNENLELEKATYANYGDYIDDHWVLKDIQESIFSDGQITRQTSDQQLWYSVLSPSILSVVGEKYLDKLSMSGLRHTIEYRKHNGLDAGPFQLAFWEKIVQPFSIAVMMFLAVPFIFGPLRSATMGLRLFAGILVGFSFHTFNEMFGHLSLVYHVPPLMGAVLPTLVFLGIGLWLLRKT